MTDLATQSLGRISLVERHKLYSDWHASSQRTLRELAPHHAGARTDSNAQPLTEKRARLVEHMMREGSAAGEVDKTSLTKAAYLAADAVLRADDAPKEVPKTITPEIRARLLEAALNVAEADMATRSDDDDTKSPVSGKSGEQPPAPKKPGSSPLNRKDDEEEKPRKVQDDDNAPTMKTVMDAIGALNKRFDVYEAKGNDDDDNDPLNSAGKPKDLAADDSALRSYRKNAILLKEGKLGQIVCDSVTMDEFVKCQARADRVYGAWGKSAPKPQHGEELNAYRRRLLIPYQHYSVPFKKADLRVLAVEDSTFAHVEEEILNAAMDAVRDPASVPMGVLRESVETRNGHTYTKFYGSPKSWMSPFAPRGMRVKRIQEQRADNQPGRTLYESAQARVS